MSRNTDPKPSLTQNNHQANEKSPNRPTAIDGGCGPKPCKADIKHVKEFNAIVRSVYDSLADHSNPIGTPRWMKETDRPKGYLAWPSTWTISNESGASRRSVHYALRKLVEAGYIVCVHRSKGGQPKHIRQKDDPELRAIAKNLRPTSAYLVFRTPQGLRSTFQKNPAKNVESSAQALHTILLEERTSQKSVVVSHSKNECSPPTPRTREALAPKTDGGGDECDFLEPNPDLLNEPVTAKHFEWLEALTDNEQITCIGRRTILRCSKQFGFTLPELAYAFKKSGMTRVGGIIKLAEDWPAQSRIIQWPSCRKCLGEGIIAFPSAPHGVAACDCAEGKRLAAQDQVTAERRTEDVSYAEWCRYNGRSHADYEACIAAEKAAAERRTAYTNAGTCPWCEGTGTVSSSNRRCGRCRGLGITERPEGSCDRCWGTGFHGYDADGKHQECISCWNKRVTKAQNTPRAIIPAPKPSQSSGPVYREL